MINDKVWLEALVKSHDEILSKRNLKYYSRILAVHFSSYDDFTKVGSVHTIGYTISKLEKDIRNIFTDFLISIISNIICEMINKNYRDVKNQVKYFSKWRIIHPKTEVMNLIKEVEIKTITMLHVCNDLSNDGISMISEISSILPDE